MIEKEPNNFTQICVELKEYIKILSKNEECIKSISFSISDEKKEFIIYFAWNRENYEDLSNERTIFRENIKAFIKVKGLTLNIIQSNSARLVFQFRIKKYGNR